MEDKSGDADADPTPEPAPPHQPIVHQPAQVFTVKSSALSVSTVAVSWAMAAQSLAVAVARFAIASTISCCSYSVSGRAVALYAAP